MSKKNQSERLTNQHKESQGVVGIFGDGTSIKKEEINKALQKLDTELGQTLFLESNISIGS